MTNVQWDLILDIMCQTPFVFWTIPKKYADVVTDLRDAYDERGIEIQDLKKENEKLKERLAYQEKWFRDQLNIVGKQTINLLNTLNNTLQTVEETNDHV